MLKNSLFLLLFPAIALGQMENNQKPSLPEIIPPSPTVANLMTFEEVPVDYYTGQPDISIPIYSKKLNSDMTLPIALKYNTQGVKTISRSGWTGTGWSLDAGGSISRTVRGIADEAKKGINKFTGIYNLPNDAFFSYNSLSDYDKGEYLWNVNGTNTDQYDSELDLYQFSILGATGRFVIEKVGPNLIPKLLTKDQNVRIEVHHNQVDVGGGHFHITEILGFTITDANGYKYYFGNIDSSTDAIEVTTSTSYSSSITQMGEAAPDFNTPVANRTKTQPSAWHLTKIKTNNLQELVSFTYASVSESYKELENHTEYILENHIRSTYFSGGFSFEGQSDPNIPFNDGMVYPKYTFSGANTTVVSQKLSQINFKDGTFINFNTSGGHPEYGGGTTLNSVQLYKANLTLWKTFSFSYSQNNRLWLDEVVETGEGASPISLRYRLEYESKSLPDYGHGNNWGYKNVSIEDGLYTNSNYIAEHKDGVLNRIIYPTGGVKEFEFEPHTYSYEGNELLPLSETDQNPLNMNNASASNPTNTYFTANAQTVSTPHELGQFTLDATQNVSLNFSYGQQSYTPLYTYDDLIHHSPNQDIEHQY